MELVRAIRNARTEYDVEPGRRIAAIVAAGENAPFLQSQAPALDLLARIDGQKLHIVSELDEKPAKALGLVVPDTECYLPLAELVDLDKEIARLRTEIETLDKEIARTTKLLGNAGFATKAPADVVQRERDNVLNILNDIPDSNSACMN